MAAYRSDSVSWTTTSAWPGTTTCIRQHLSLPPRGLFVRNQDRPGFIGQFGSIMGSADVNIATFNLGREKPGGDAITVVAVDERVSDEVLAQVAALPQVLRARRLSF